MSYEDGWAAIHLEKPSRVPRTEYSAESHWELIQAVTGISVSATSPDHVKQQAGQAFVQTWNYGLFWSIGIYKEIFVMRQYYYHQKI